MFTNKISVKTISSLNRNTFEIKVNEGKYVSRPHNAKTENHKHSISKHRKLKGFLLSNPNCLVNSFQKMSINMPSEFLPLSFLQTAESDGQQVHVKL